MPHSQDFALIFIEMGVAIIGLSLLSRFAIRFGFSTIPLYLLAGLALGNGGFLPLRFTESFVQIGGEIGVLLLLFMLGLEYTGEELGKSLRSGLPSGLVDFALNFTPGLAAGFLLGWSWLAAVLLGGVTYISSSGVISRVLSELKRLKNPETPTIISILVLEDLAMALYLPLVAVLLSGEALHVGLISISVALLTVFTVLVIAVKYGRAISGLLIHESDEVLLFSILGLVLLVAGISQKLQVSAAVGAFLVGIAVSGPMARRTYKLLGPIRDLSAAAFFLFFGLQIDPATLPPVLLLAIGLGVVTSITKLLTGFWAAKRAGVDSCGGLRAGAALTARGEFSIVIAGLGVSAGVEPKLGSLAAAYVLFLAIVGPLLARFIEPIYQKLQKPEESGVV